MRLQDYFQAGVVAELGYAPTSGSIKPVHVANGLCRSALGEAYDPRLLNRFVNRWAKRGTEERHSTDEIVADAADRLGDLAEPSLRSKLNELRAHLRATLGADGGVWDKNENCSYTLTHRTHLTKDHNDRGTGAFVYHLLNADLGEGPSPALALLRDLLSEETDEISLLVSPLVFGEEPLSTPVIADAPASLRLKERSSPPTFRSAIARELRAGFDALATFERESGSKLQSLRRLATFASLALFLHIVNRIHDLDDPRGATNRRTPILLDFTRTGWSPTALASHATYNLACKGIERLVTRGLWEALSAEHGEKWTTRKVEEFVEDLEVRGTESAQKHKRKHFLEVFRSYSAGGNTMSESLSLAAVDAFVEDLNGTPFDFARSLGIRIGLLAPRGQRGVKKRYSPSPELLEILLASTLRAGEETDLETLADQWWTRFGIVTGVRSADARTLNQFSILDATKEDLDKNAECLREVLIEIGYARPYADGVTIIGIGARR